jgi:hypothetical protein
MPEEVRAKIEELDRQLAYGEITVKEYDKWKKRIFGKEYC